MPLPLILIPLAIAAGAVGIGTGIHGGVKMNRANKKLKDAEKRDKANQNRVESKNVSTSKVMDLLGNHEMEILASFGTFSTLFERIKNKPTFAELKIGDFALPKFDKKKIEDASVGASVLLGGLGGAALGTAGAFAASGATTAAVMALGTASTGTAISALSGVAATNATLAALGGGSIAAGGGGMALGSMVLGGATLGVGLLIGGVIFSISGSHIEGKADKAIKQVEENERKGQKIVNYLEELSRIAKRFDSALMKVYALYKRKMNDFSNFMSSYKDKHVYWSDLTQHQQSIVETVVMLIGLLYEMCKVKIVEQNQNADGLNSINHNAINAAITNADTALGNVA
jgi:hypothetical protein